MSTLSRTGIPYPDMLAALGRFIAKLGISDVCVMEFESGVIVTGTKLYATGEQFNRLAETKVLSVEDLKRLVKEQ